MLIKRDVKLMLLGLFLSPILGYLLSSYTPLVASLEAYMSYKWMLLVSTSLLFVLCLVVPMYIQLSIKYKRKTKLSAHFGVFWDNNQEPYCPSCEIPLSQMVFDEKTDLSCIKCNQSLWLTSKDKDISLEDARALLKKYNN